MKRRATPPRALQARADACLHAGQAAGPVQRQAEEEEPLQGKAIQRQAEEEEPLQAKPEAEANRTGMPDRLKAGVEALSGLDMSGVRVQANSPEPARVNALAYAQGDDIHLAPGQERHLPHEAWHVVQQRQGRVQPTLQAHGAAINDDPSLEREADVMGAQAMATGAGPPAEAPPAAPPSAPSGRPTASHCPRRTGISPVSSTPHAFLVSRYVARDSERRGCCVYTTLRCVALEFTINTSSRDRERSRGRPS